jgi:hypothetical protein
MRIELVNGNGQVGLCFAQASAEAIRVQALTGKLYRGIVPGAHGLLGE